MITKAMLDDVVKELNQAAQTTDDNKYYLIATRGRYNLYQEPGENLRSPLLHRRELYTWLHAYIDGIDVGKAITWHLTFDDLTQIEEKEKKHSGK